MTSSMTKMVMMMVGKTINDNSIVGLNNYHFVLKTIVTCDIQVDDELENYSDSATGVEFVFDEEDVIETSLEVVEAMTKQLDRLSENIEMSDLYQYKHHLGMNFMDEVEDYVCSNFQSLNPEITLMNMRISYKVIGDTNHPV